MEIAEGGRPPGSREQDYDSVRSYQQAMDRVRSLATDPTFECSVSRINDLHWLATNFLPGGEPGRLRNRAASVTGWDGRVVYEAPPADQVVGLMEELVDRLKNPPRNEDPIVTAAMAHLDLISIHPYQNGNGPISRIVQSLVLAREAMLPPELGSIDVYIGSHTQGYYESLRSVHGRSFEPSRDPSPWVDFCLEAHRQEAVRLKDRLRVGSAQAILSEQLTSRHRFPERFAIPLESSLAGLEVRNESYRKDASVAVATAKQDLGRLVTAGWLTPRGGGRNAHYVASDRLTRLWDEVRDPLLQQQDLLQKRGSDGDLSRREQRELQVLRHSLEQRISDSIGRLPSESAEVERRPEPQRGR